LRFVELAGFNVPLGIIALAISDTVFLVNSLAGHGINNKNTKYNEVPAQKNLIINNRKQKVFSKRNRKKTKAWFRHLLFSRLVRNVVDSCL